ncbi:hypothetical protein HDE_04210 [Halotydeus destructor]|nr:hypothetical protein HDE_04210 [Halotydeus destructor]
MDKGQSIGTEIGLYFMEKVCYAGLNAGKAKDVAVIFEQTLPCFLGERFLGFKMPTIPIDPVKEIKEIQKDCHPEGSSRDYCKKPDRDKIMPCLQAKAPIYLPQLAGIAPAYCVQVSQLMDKMQPARMKMMKQYVDTVAKWIKAGRKEKFPKFDCNSHKI